MRLPIALHLFVACTFLAAVPAAAQDRADAKDPQAAGEKPADYVKQANEGQLDFASTMEAYEKAGQPGAPHEALAGMAGNWTAAVTMFDPAGTPNTLPEASVESKMIMDGRYLLEEVTGEFMGQSFAGAGVTGFNNATGKYEGVWIDNHGTAVSHYTGSMEGDALAMSGKYKDPVSGDWVKTRSVRKIISDDQMTDTAWETRGDTEVKTMEIAYTRKP